MLINAKIAQINRIFRFSPQKPVIYPAKNVKMPTIIGILTFMSRIILVSAEMSMKKSFITSSPGIGGDQTRTQSSLL